MYAGMQPPQALAYDPPGQSPPNRLEDAGRSGTQAQGNASSPLTQQCGPSKPPTTQSQGPPSHLKLYLPGKARQGGGGGLTGPERTGGGGRLPSSVSLCLKSTRGEAYLALPRRTRARAALIGLEMQQLGQRVAH
jgi:hypothetical protein